MLNQKRWFANISGALAIATTLLFIACSGEGLDKSPTSGTVLPPPPADVTAPTVVITDDTAAATATGNVTFTFTFSEAITTGFDASLITVTGGTKGTFTRVSATVSTLVVVPTANTASTINVSVAAGAFTDLSGLDSTVAASASQAYDTTVPALTQMDLPVTFDSTTVDYGIIPFGDGGTAAAIGKFDPVDAANNCVKFNKATDSASWAGVTISKSAAQDTGIASNAFATKTVVLLDVYCPAIGTPILVKFENLPAKDHNIEVQMLSTKANAWETLAFDFTGKPVAGATYNHPVVFPDFGNTGTAKVILFDNLRLQ